MHFSFDQNAGKSLKSIITKIEFSKFCRFQDVSVQSYQFSSYISVAFWQYVTEDQLLESWFEFTKKNANLQFCPFT